MVKDWLKIIGYTLGFLLVLGLVALGVYEEVLRILFYQHFVP